MSSRHADSAIEGDWCEQHALGLCAEHGWPPIAIPSPVGELLAPSAVCVRGDKCLALHLCRLHVSGYCPLPATECRHGHSLTGGNNDAVLRRFRLQHVTPAHVLWMVRLRVQQETPVTRGECWGALRLCAHYNSGRCARARGTCSRLHLCARLVRGDDCSAAGDMMGVCGLIHRPTHADNLMCLTRLHFADLFDEEIVSVVRAVEQYYAGESAGSSAVRDSGSGGDFLSLSPLSPLSDELGAADPADPNGPSSPCSPVARDSLHLRALLEGVDICSSHLAPNVCSDSTCRRLHLCRYFVADLCPYGESCVGCHGMTARVRKFLSALVAGSPGASEMAEVSFSELVDALQCGYLTRHPIVQSERQRLFQLCLNPVCRDADNSCYRVHLCVMFVLGKCELGAECARSHDIHSAHNQVVLEEYHMDQVGDDQLIKLLSVNSARVARKKLAEWKTDRPVAALTPKSKFKPLMPAKVEPTRSKKEPDSPATLLNVCKMSLNAMRCNVWGCSRTHVCLAHLMEICRRRPCPLPHVNLPLPYPCRALVRASQRLMICGAYNTWSQQCAGAGCSRFHLCHRFLSSSCAGDCGLSHNMVMAYNQAVKERVGLGAVPDLVVLELLRSRLGLPCGSLSSGGDDPSARNPFVRLVLVGGVDDDSFSTVSAQSSVGRGSTAASVDDNSYIDVLSDCSSATNAPLSASSKDQHKDSTTTTPSSTGHHVAKSETLPQRVCSAALSVTVCSDFHCQRQHPCLPHLLGVCRRQRCQWSHEVSVKLPPVFRPLMRACAKLGVCVVYNGAKGCSGKCVRFHLCQKFLASTCVKDGDCILCHSIVTDFNQSVKEDIGLKMVPDAVLLELLRARMGCLGGCPPPVIENNPFLDLRLIS